MLEKKIIYTFVLLLCYATAFSKLSFEPIEIDKNTSKSINENIWVWAKKNTSKTDFWKIQSDVSTAFYLNKEVQDVNYGFQKKTAWCTFKIKNTAQKTRFILQIEQSRVDAVQLFILDQDGKVRQFPYIDKSIHIENRPVLDLQISYKIELDTSQTIQCFLYSERKFGDHSCMVKIYHEDTFQAYNTGFVSYFSFVSGIIVLAVLIGLILYCFVRDKTYLAYSIYASSILFINLSDVGFFHSFLPLPKAYTYMYNNLVASTFLLGVCWHIIFTVVLLKLNTLKYKWFYYLGLVSSGCFMCMSSMLFFPIPDTLRDCIIKFSYFNVFFMDVYIIASVFLSFQKKKAYVIFYLLGFLSTLIATTVLLLANIGWIDGVNNNYNFAYSIPLIEIFFMVIGLGFHFSGNIEQVINIQRELYQSQKAVIGIQDEERKRVAQDLHDGLGQDLLLLKYAVQGDEKKSNEISNIINNMRRISRDLYPIALEKSGLKEGIENICTALMQTSELFVTTEIDYKAIFSKEIELQLFRIIQEAVTNAVKYSEAKALKIRILTVDNLCVIIQDNGKGFDVTEALKNKNSFGINSIIQRTKSLKGKCHIISNPKGTIINISIPFPS